MDSAEYPVALLQNHEGRSEEDCLAEFRAVLQDIESRFSGSAGLLAVFDADSQILSEKLMTPAGV